MEQQILDGEIGYDLLLSDFQNKESVLINSPGGSLFEGLAMYDYVQGHDIEVGVIGVSASAATLPLIASSKRWGTPNSRYLIHNPWSMEIGDASAMEKSAKELKSEQNRALQLYVQHLNGTAEELQSLMNEERILDADEALQLGLIKEIRQINQESDKPEGTDIKNLFNQFKMSYEMKEDDKKELSGLSKKVDELTKMVKNFFSPKMVTLQDTNGTELEFPEAETEDQIAVDQPVIVNGEQGQTGNYARESVVFVVVDGVLKDIEATEDTEEEQEDDVEALKTENEQLKQQLADVQNKLETSDSSLVTMTAERDGIQSKLTAFEPEFNTLKDQLNEFKNKFSDDKPLVKTNDDKEEETQKKTTFNKSKLKQQ